MRLYMSARYRRDVLDRTYEVLRRRAALDRRIERAVTAGEPPDRERARMIAALVQLDGWSADRIAGAFDGGQYRPARLSEGERALARALEGRTVGDPDEPLTVRLEFPAWLEPAFR